MSARLRRDGEIAYGIAGCVEYFNGAQGRRLSEIDSTGGGERIGKSTQTYEADLGDDFSRQVDRPADWYRTGGQLAGQRIEERAMAPLPVNGDVADGSAIGSDAKTHDGVDDVRIAIQGALWNAEHKRTRADCEHHLRIRPLFAGYRQGVIKRCTGRGSARTGGTGWTEVLKEEGGRCRGHVQKKPAPI